MAFKDPNSGPSTTERVGPYRVEIDTPGCAHCGARKQWHVVGPDGVAGSVSYESEEDAEAEADDKNDAYWKGWEARFP